MKSYAFGSVHLCWKFLMFRFPDLRQTVFFASLWATVLAAFFVDEFLDVSLVLLGLGVGLSGGLLESNALASMPKSLTNAPRDAPLRRTAALSNLSGKAAYVSRALAIALAAVAATSKNQVSGIGVISAYGLAHQLMLLLAYIIPRSDKR